MTPETFGAGAVEMFIENTAVAIAPFESFACIVKENDPAIVGVPRISPVAGVNDKPFGSAPLARFQVYGGVPPAALTRQEYTPPTPPTGSEAVVICTGFAPLAAADDAGLITNENLRDAIAPCESVTCIVKENVPAAVGVPSMSPVTAVNFSPAGSAPAFGAHAYGGVPPLAFSRHAYATCTPPEGKVAVVTI